MIEILVVIVIMSILFAGAAMYVVRDRGGDLAETVLVAEAYKRAVNEYMDLNRGQVPTPVSVLGAPPIGWDPAAQEKGPRSNVGKPTGSGAVRYELLQNGVPDPVSSGHVRFTATGGPTISPASAPTDGERGLVEYGITDGNSFYFRVSIASNDAWKLRCVFVHGKPPAFASGVARC